MNFVKASICLVFLGFGCHADVLRIGTEGGYPPFNFINDDGNLDGLDREFGDELCHRMEVECEWVVNDWDSIIPNLVNGNYDLLIATMGITPEREQVIDFTQEYLPAEPSAFVASSSFEDATTIRTVATQVNTIQAEFVANSNATLVEFSSADETIAAVINGEVDVVLAGKEFLKKIVGESDGQLAFVGETVRLGFGAGIGVRESDPELKAKANSAITSMKSDGFINDLIESWLGPDAEKF